MYIKIAKLRALIAYLGEKREWWPTKFLEENASGFLEYTFPRSKNASLTAVIAAATTIINEKIGPSYFHLFQLNIVLEEQIHGYLKTMDIPFTSEIEAYDQLKEISQSLVADQTPGPKNIGSLDGLDEDNVQAMAAEYLSAFKNNYEVYPYLH